jgi:hypothetical protein
MDNVVPATGARRRAVAAISIDNPVAAPPRRAQAVEPVAAEGAPG